MLRTLRHRAIPSEPTVDRRGYPRSVVTLSSYRKGKPSPNRGRRFPPEPPTPEEVYAMLDACGRGPAGRRNRAIITIMWRAGLRCAEVLALYPKDIDLEHGMITVLRGKGGKRRVVAIDPAAGAVVQAWLDARKRFGLNGTHPVFCTISKPNPGLPMYGTYVRGMVKRVAERAGVEKNIRPHQFRHAYASYYGDLVPLPDLQRMLGHSSLAVTARYLHEIYPGATLDRMRSVPWPEGDGARLATAATRAAPVRGRSRSRASSA